MSDTRIFIDGGLLLLAVFLISRVAKRKYPAPLPPGPKGYPIIGNMLDMPASYPWRTFTEWGTKFGESTSLHSILTCGRVMLMHRSRRNRPRIRPWSAHRHP